MKHSILITHRDRQRYLVLCLWSIGRAARRCGADDWEVVIVDNGSERPLADPEKHAPHNLHVSLGVERERCRVIVDQRKMRPFNKPALYNVAIEAARGDVLTFLDADAIVGSKWFHNLAALDQDPRIVRLCYRARYLPEHFLGDIEAAAKRMQFVDRLFADYEQYDLAWEAYREPNRNRYEPEYLEQVYGNSQFSVTREKLGQLRPNEEYAGHGAEDIEFARQFQRKYGDAYRGHLNPNADYSLFLLRHPKDPEWADNAVKRRNTQRFNAT